MLYYSPNYPKGSKHFCQFLNKFKKAIFEKYPFRNPNDFTENILLATVSSCSKRIFSKNFEMMGKKLIAP